MNVLWFGEIISPSLGAILFARIFVIIFAKLWIRLIGLNLSAEVACSFLGSRMMKAELSSNIVSYLNSEQKRHNTRHLCDLHKCR